MRRLWGLLVVAAWLVAAAPAHAQVQEALKLVPEDALGFGIVTDVGQVSAQVEAMLKRFKVPQEGSPLEKAKGEFGLGKGFNDKGTLVIVALPPKGGDEPTGVVLVPVTDYPGFLTTVKGDKKDGDLTEVQLGGKAMLAGHKGGFAILAEPKHKDDLQRVLKGGGKGILSAQIQSLLKDGGSATVVTSAGIKLLAGKAREELGKAKDKADTVPPEAQFVFGWLDGLGKFLQRIESDVSHLALVARADQAGNVDFSAHALFAPGSEFAKAGGKVASPAGGPLAGLPAGPFMIAAGGALPGNVMEGLMNLGVQVLTAANKDAAPEKIKQLEEAYRESTKGLRGFAMVMGLGKEKGPLFDNIVGIMKVDDSDAYLKSYVRSMEAMNEAMKSFPLPQGGNISYEVKQVKLAGKPAVVVTTDLGPGDDGNPIEKQLKELYFGQGGKMSATIVPVDKNTVLMRYTGPDRTEEFLKGYQATGGGLAQDAQVAKTLAALPKGTQFVFLLDPAGTVQVANRAIGMFLPEGGGGFRLPDFPAAPPLGFGVRSSGEGLELHFVLPAATQEGVGNFVEQLKRLGSAAGTRVPLR